MRDKTLENIAAYQRFKPTSNLECPTVQRIRKPMISSVTAKDVFILVMKDKPKMLYDNATYIIGKNGKGYLLMWWELKKSWTIVEVLLSCPVLN